MCRRNFAPTSICRERWSGTLPRISLNASIAQGVPSYTRLDSGLTWRWKEGVSLSLVGQNLLRDHQLEFADCSGATQSTRNQAERLRQIDMAILVNRRKRKRKKRKRE